MSRAGFTIPDYPADRPRADEVARKVAAYYERPGNGSGGNCHVVLDDCNTDLASVRCCLEQCRETGDGDGEAIMRAMLAMTGTQRRKTRLAARRVSCG